MKGEEGRDGDGCCVGRGRREGGGGGGGREAGAESEPRFTLMCFQTRIIEASGFPLKRLQRGLQRDRTQAPCDNRRLEHTNEYMT